MSDNVGGFRGTERTLNCWIVSPARVALTVACASALRWFNAATLSKFPSTAALLATATLSWFERASAAVWHVVVSAGLIEPVMVGEPHGTTEPVWQTASRWRTPSPKVVVGSRVVPLAGIRTIPFSHFAQDFTLVHAFAGDPTGMHAVPAV